MSGSIAMQPLTWKPPMQTGMPAARSGRAMSTARGKLVGLHADQADQPAASAAADLLDDLVGPDAGVGLVPDGDPDLDVVAQHAALGAVERKAVQRRQRVGGNRRARPLDDIALVVVVRRLDQEKMEGLSFHRWRCGNVRSSRIEIRQQRRR